MQVILEKSPVTGIWNTYGAPNINEIKRMFGETRQIHPTDCLVWVSNAPGRFAALLVGDSDSPEYYAVLRKITSCTSEEVFDADGRRFTQDQQQKNAINRMMELQEIVNNHSWQRK